MNFFIVFALYPGVFLEGKIRFIEDNDWRIWFTIFIFTIGDTTGRFLAGIARIKADMINAPLTLLRFGFFATSFLCAYDVSIFENDALKIANVIGTSISFGYIVNSQIINSFVNVKQSDSESMGKLVNIFLTLGIVLGSLVASFGFAKIF